MRDTLGQYKILDRIGAGEIGELYRARDTRLGRTVAIRLLASHLDDDGDRRERFLKDARSGLALSHPNITALYEIGEDRDVRFLVFEFVPGEPLSTIIGGRSLNPRRALDLTIQLADAPAQAHAGGVGHFDLKPDNVLVTPKGHAKILDFGLSEWTAGGKARAGASRLAAVAAEDADQVLARTIPYLSPEQALGEPADSRSDIFSLGSVLFEMLTGKLPFPAATHSAQVLQILLSPAPAPATVSPALPVELDAIVARMLAKNPDGRYASASTVAEELRSVTSILDVRDGVSEPLVVTKRSRLERVGWVIAALILVVLVGIVWLAVRSA